jgi:hypothetical protein
MSTPPPLNPIEEEYYGSFKALIRASLPDGQRLLADLKSAYDAFFEAEQIILSRKERHRLFERIVQEVMSEMAEAMRQLKP